MTPIKSFRPRWADRCLYRRKPFFRKLGWCILILLAVYGLWFSVTQHQMYAEAGMRIAKAETEREMLLAVLNGKAQMVEYAGKYAVVERVTWEVKE